MLKIFKPGINTDVEEVRTLKAELVRKLDEVNLLKDELKKNIEITEKTFTVIKKFNFDDINYLSKIREIWESPEFRFHIYNTKQVIVNQIAQGDKEVALLCQGMLKGVDMLLDSTYKAAMACGQLEAGKNG
jgi:hypothetical protein